MRSQSVSHHVDNQKRIIESLLEGLENHSDYVKEHPAPDFWMRVCVHDIRRVHIWLDTACGNRKEKSGFICRERSALRSALKRLPFRLSIDYAVLCLASLSPLLILDVQRFLRTMKRWIKR